MNKKEFFSDMSDQDTELDIDNDIEDKQLMNMLSEYLNENSDMKVKKKKMKIPIVKSRRQPKKKEVKVKTKDEKPKSKEDKPKKNKLKIPKEKKVKSKKVKEDVNIKEIEEDEKPFGNDIEGRVIQTEPVLPVYIC